MSRRGALVNAAVLAALALAWGGCSDSGPGWSRSWRPLPAPASPVADSPDNAVRMLEWCWEHLEATVYRDLFTDDYRFVFAALDRDGNTYGDPWTREDELASFDHLVHGGDANQPRIVSASVQLDANFRVGPDPRYPESAQWRKLIRTAACLRLVDAGGGQLDASGYVSFYLVRGDSAAIPPDLIARGVGPDSTRWYVQRWEDDTCPGDGARVVPTKQACWGSIKVAYR